MVARRGLDWNPGSHGCDQNFSKNFSRERAYAPNQIRWISITTCLRFVPWSMQDTLSSFWQIVRGIVWDHLVQVYRACRPFAVSRLTKMASSVLNNLPSHYLQTQMALSVLNNLPSHYLQPYIGDELRGLLLSLVEMKPLAIFSDTPACGLLLSHLLL